jgi:sec-independent protein translocase protein TatB
MADLKKSFDEVKEAASGFASGNIMTSLQKDVSDSLQIGDIDKPVDAQIASAIDTPVTSPSDAPVISQSDALAGPTPETVVEPEAHAAVNEPLAITREVQSQPVPQDVTPAEPEVLKDAKAS